MKELARRDFLINRDGIQKTLEWYRQVIKRYRKAAEMALEPREENETRICARGKEWNQTYLKTVFECRIVIKSLDRL